MTVGENIRNIRTSLNLSQKDFGERILINQRTISDWENNVTFPSVEIIRLIAKTFDVSYDELLD